MRSARGAAIAAVAIAACEAGGSPGPAADLRIVDELPAPVGGSFWAPVDVAVAGDHLWVLDAGAGKALGYDGDRIHRWTAGRPGSGPGELRDPLAIGTLGDTLWVWNAGNRRIEYFAADGSAIGAEPLPDSIPAAVDVAAIGGALYATAPFATRPVVRFAPGGGEVRSFGAELARKASSLNPDPTRIPDVYRIDAIDGDLWVLHLYLPVGAIYRPDGRLRRLLSWPGPAVEAGEVRTARADGRDRRVLGAPRRPVGGLGVLAGQTTALVLSHQRDEEGRQRLFAFTRSGEPRGSGLAPAGRVLVSAARAGARSWVVGARGELDEPSVFLVETVEGGPGDAP